LVEEVDGLLRRLERGVKGQGDAGTGVKKQ
jgi:hypothetical protein